MKWKNRSPLFSDELSRLKGQEPHELLALSPRAGLTDIKRAYRRMVMTYHPDRADPFMRRHNGQVTRLINAAYARLISQWKERQ